MKHTRFEIKGDVFESMWNPSGRIGTVEQNGFLVSLVTRYEYYSRRPELVARVDVVEYVRRFLEDPRVNCPFLDFRENVAMATYGDDVLVALRPGLVEFFDDALWERDFGILITDGSKTAARTTCKTIHEVTFLKRKFVFDHELGRYIMPLDVKSIVKTLVMRTKSDLSDIDHAEVTLFGCLMEATLHGEAFFTRLRGVVLQACDLWGIAVESRVRTFTWEVARARVVTGDFSMGQETMTPEVNPFPRLECVRGVL